MKRLIYVLLALVVIMSFTPALAEPECQPTPPPEDTPTYPPPEDTPTLPAPGVSPSPDPSPSETPETPGTPTPTPLDDATPTPNYGRPEKSEQPAELAHTGLGFIPLMGLGGIFFILMIFARLGRSR